MNQSVRKGFAAGVVVLFFTIIALWFSKNLFIQQYADRKLGMIEKQRQLSIHYNKIGLDGICTLQIDGLSVVPAHSDTFLYAGSIQVQLNIKSLLLLKVDIDHIIADSLHIHFIKQDSTSNFDFLYRRTRVTPESAQLDDEERNYAHKAEQTFNLLFKLLPQNASLHHLCLSYSNKEDELLIEVPSLIIKENQFVTNIQSTENGQYSEWVCEGFLKDDEQRIKALLHAKENRKISLPFLEYRWGASIQFDTLAFELEGLREKTDLKNIRGKAHVSGLTLYQERISPDTIMLDQGTFSYLLNVGKNYLELDSSTEVCFNKLNFHPYLKAEKDSTWRLIASVNKPAFPANDLLTSLPRGLFYNLEGLQAEGGLSYHFLLDVDFARLDSLIFESTLQSRNFRILQQGNTDLRKMNEPFLYTAYEQGEPVRTFEIGEGNPSFRRFNTITRYLPLAIMQSEDAGFFHHNGFIPSAIRESLILDLKERRFARGGSTLSMQLVKNVFLSRNKTIARKLEEILIVWLIESNHLTSKERMFEVYLNIIEWGPSIYGASEASHYYFAKEPSQLTLGECIFLASIIPKPKHVRSCFDGSSLKPYYEEFYRIVLGRLVDRKLISPEEAIGITPDIEIIGPAKEYIFRQDSTVNGSLARNQLLPLSPDSVRK